MEVHKLLTPQDLPDHRDAGRRQRDLPAPLEKVEKPTVTRNCLPRFSYLLKPMGSWGYWIPVCGMGGYSAQVA
jgi:hypothetical protein